MMRRNSIVLLVVGSSASAQGCVRDVRQGRLSKRAEEQTCTLSSVG